LKNKTLANALCRPLLAAVVMLATLVSTVNAEEKQLTEEQLTENPGGTEDDSYVNPESLPHQAGYDKRAEFGSMSNTVNQLEEDDRVKEPVIRFARIDQGLGGWYKMKRRLNEQSGVKFGFDYNSLYQSVSKSLTDDDSAWSSVFRVLGTWELLNKGEDNPGTLVFGVESRHNVSHRISPAELASQIGYIGVTGTLFNDVDSILGNLYFKQSFSNGKAGYLIGRFDPNDFQSVLGYANPWTTFSNVAILLAPTVAFADWSWGVGGGGWIGEKENWYFQGSINDANGTITDESFFDGGAEFYKHLEFGWSPSRAERYFTNIHLTAWHVDAREDAGIGSAHGITIGANKTWNETWMLFGRAGWSKGAAPIYNQTATVGVGRLIRNWSDVFGFGVNWGRPPDSSLPEQWSAEVFYRLQLSQNLQLTPSLQYLKDPALNSEHSSIWVAGLRMRINL
jgi:porin